MHAATGGAWRGAAALILVAAAACDRRDEQRERDRERARRDEVTIADSASAASIADLARDPALWAGRTVVLEGEVRRSEGPRLFVLGEDGLGEDELLVVVAADTTRDGAPAAPAWTEEAEVRVTGTVRPLSPAEIERRLAVDLTPELEAKLRTMAVVEAERVEGVGR
jgi:hypothetical protein